MAPHLRIQGERVAIVSDTGRLGFQISQEKFVSRIVRHHAPPEGFFPLHKSVRFFSFAGSSGVVVVELEPEARLVRWIRDDSNAVDTRTLALPYVVLVLPFYDGVLQTGTDNGCQVFYRTSSLVGWDDPLFQTNLLNVADAYGYKSWLCMMGYAQRQGLSWQEAIEEAIRYFYWSAFNRSAEVHERNSHYSTARNKRYDQRISSAAAWEQYSIEDPKFMLQIRWPRTGHTVRSAVNLAASKFPRQDLNLANIVQEG